MLWRLRKATVENIIWSKIPPWLQSNEWIEHAFLNLPPPAPSLGMFTLTQVGVVLTAHSSYLKNIMIIANSHL